MVLFVLFFFPLLFSQARQILEREYNNLLALGTDRRLDEVSGNRLIRCARHNLRVNRSQTKLKVVKRDSLAYAVRV